MHCALRPWKRLLSIVAFGVGALAPPAHAEPGGTARTETDRVKARDLMREGNELYGNGKLSDAYGKYLEAWRTAQAFDIACNLGGTASELSMNRDAAEYLDYCLRHYAASSRPEAVAAEQRARAAFDVVRSKVATVNVRVTPAGAEVYVDGARAGRAPLDAPVYLEAGPHRIEARQAGLETVTAEIDAKRGETIETSIDLKGVSGAALAAESSPSRANSGENPRFDSAPGGSKDYVPAIVTASIGGVALAGGVVFLVMRAGKQSDAEDKLGTLGGNNPCGPGTSNATECGEIADLSEQAATFGTFSLVSFGVAAGAGVATFLLWPKGGDSAGTQSVHRRVARLRPSVAASHEGLYASVRGEF
jgi:hypothetical protein